MFLMNQRQHSLLDNLTYGITVYTKNESATEESLQGVYDVITLTIMRISKKAIRHNMHIVSLLLLTFILLYKTICCLGFFCCDHIADQIWP